MYAGLPGLVVPFLAGPKSRAVPRHPRFEPERLVAPGPDQPSHRKHCKEPSWNVPHRAQKQKFGSGGRLTAVHARFQQAPSAP